MSTAGKDNSRRSGFAALRWGRSKAIRLWPRTKDAPPASSSSFASADVDPPPECPWPVSPRTAPKAWMRPSSLPTSRSRDRQQGLKGSSSFDAGAPSCVSARGGTPRRSKGILHIDPWEISLKAETTNGRGPYDGELALRVVEGVCSATRSESDPGMHESHSGSAPANSRGTHVWGRVAIAVSDRIRDDAMGMQLGPGLREVSRLKLTAIISCPPALAFAA